MVLGGFLKRSLIFSIALVISVGTILPVFAPTVSAANINTVSPTDEAKSTSYYRTLRTCINNEMNTTIQLTGGDNGVANPSTWFSDNNAYGYIFPEGKTDCKDVVPKALQLWGWGSDYSAFLKQLGFSYNAGDAKWTVANRDNLRSKFDSAVQAKYYGVNFAGEPTQSEAARYEMFLNTFNKACNAKDLGAVSSITNSSYKAWLDDSSADQGTQVSEETANISGTKDGSYVYFAKVDVVETVNGELRKVPHGYAYQASSAVANEGWNGGNATSNGDVRIYGYHNSAVERSCHQIQKGITENAGAWQVWARSQPTAPVPPQVSSGGTTPGGEDGEVTSSCGIEGIGWILCPVINALAWVADASFNFLADSFLRTDPKVFNTDDAVYKAWSVMRNIANILFVIAFLFIVFSQLTGVGISNYGVKKMIPRIVVAAILVNVSYFIAQLAIDVSNILGYSIRDVFTGVISSVNAAGTSTTAEGMSNFATGGGGGFVAISGQILGAGLAVAAVYLLLSAFGPILLAVVLALILIFFILIARQAAIVLLVVLSPLAFVAFLLPNTESLFKSWKKIFTALLLLFPIIALVYGGSALASSLIGTSFSGIGGADSALFGQIIAAAVLVLPLFAVPALLKKSLDGVPMVGQMASKWANRATGNVGAKFKEGNRGSLVGRGAAIRKQGRENYRAKRFAEKVTGGGKMGAINRLAAGGVPIPLDKAGKASRDSLQKVASAATYRAQVEEVEDAKKLIENENLSGKQRQELALNGRVKTTSGKIIDGDVAQKAAIQMQLGGAGSMGDVHEIVNASSSTLSKFSQTIGQGAISSSGKDPALAGKSIDLITQGEFKYDTAVKLAFSQGKYTSESVASMHDGARAEALRVAQAAQAAGDPSMMIKLQDAVKGIEESPELRAKLSGNDVFGKQVRTIKNSGVLGGAATPTGSQVPPTGGTQAGTAGTASGGTNQPASSVTQTVAATLGTVQRPVGGTNPFPVRSTQPASGNVTVVNPPTEPANLTNLGTSTSTLNIPRVSTTTAPIGAANPAYIGTSTSSISVPLGTSGANVQKPTDVTVTPSSTAVSDGLYRINSAGKPIRPKDSGSKNSGAQISAKQAAVIDANADLIKSRAGAQSAAAAAQAASLARGETFDQAKDAADEAYRKHGGGA